MCNLKAAHMHERPFRATKEPVQPLAPKDSFLPYGKRFDFPPILSSVVIGT